MNIMDCECCGNEASVGVFWLFVVVSTRKAMRRPPREISRGCCGLWGDASSRTCRQASLVLQRSGASRQNAKKSDFPNLL
jgi:hypothetical protein